MALDGINLKISVTYFNFLYCNQVAFFTKIKLFCFFHIIVGTTKRIFFLKSKIINNAMHVIGLSFVGKSFFINEFLGNI